MKQLSSFKKCFLILAVVLVCFGTSLYAGNLTFRVGYFYPSLKSDLWEENIQLLNFNKNSMDAPFFGMEYEIFLNPYFSVGVEGGYYHKTRDALLKVYGPVDTDNIPHDLSLKIGKMDINAKFYPLGSNRRISPYVGLGANLNLWKYHQWKDFIVIEHKLFEAQYYKSSALTPGFNAKAGVVYQFKHPFGIVIEGRYDYLKGRLSERFGFDDKLDMSGFKLSVGLLLKL